MIKIKRIGFNWVHGRHFYVNQTNSQNNYLFLLFRSKVNIHHGTETVFTESPAIFIFKKNSEKKYSSADNIFINDWFYFDGDRIGNKDEVDTLLKDLNIPLQTPIFVNDVQSISNMIRDLEYEFRQPGMFQTELIDAKVRVLLCKMACICHQEKNIPQSANRYRSEFTNIRNRIYQFHETHISIPALAEQINMSTSYFHHTYKSLFGVSPGKDIIQSRIEYACTLLKSESLSVAGVSERCNYSNVEHFIRQFKQFMKCSPGEYRNMDIRS